MELISESWVSNMGTKIQKIQKSGWNKSELAMQKSKFRCPKENSNKQFARVKVRWERLICYTEANDLIIFH